VLRHPDFVSGKFDTHFVNKNFKPEFLQHEQPDEAEIAALVAAHIFENQSGPTRNGPVNRSTARGKWINNRIS
jgi:acetyl/propionyl-CoA carboxylase alpha subunit